jgi:hypothetical protein
MATSYLCIGCNETFVGRDPIPLLGRTILAVCPKMEALEDEIRSKAHYNDYENFLEIQSQVDAVHRKHPITLATTVKVAGAWGTGKLKATTESAAERKKREEEAAQSATEAKRQQAAEALDFAARRLLQRIDRAIQQKAGGKSAQFPRDLEYGTRSKGDLETEKLEVITAASVLWRARGADYSYRAPAWKQVWSVEMANFEQAIVSGNWSEGKHNFHVVVRQ